MKPKPILSDKQFSRWVRENCIIICGRYDVIDAVERWGQMYGDRYDLPSEIWQSYDDAIRHEKSPFQSLEDCESDCLREVWAFLNEIFYGMTALVSAVFEVLSSVPDL